MTKLQLLKKLQSPGNEFFTTYVQTCLIGAATQNPTLSRVSIRYSQHYESRYRYDSRYTVIPAKGMSGVCVGEKLCVLAYRDRTGLFLRAYKAFA